MILEQHINIETDTKYIKPIAIRHIFNMLRLFDTLNKKFDICSLHNVSIIDETSFNKSIKITILIIGVKIVANNNTKPVAPTAFFIKTLLAIIKPIPSDKYEPNGK